MLSGSTNEGSSEGLDLNSEALPLREEVVSVVRVTESSTVAVSLSVPETLAKQESIAQGSNPEGEASEVGVSVEGKSLLETFDVREGGMGAYGFEGSSSIEEREEEKEVADVGLIKKGLEDEPDVVPTPKVCALNAQELKDRGEVTEAGSSMMISKLTVEETHVSSGEKTLELEISGVSNPKGDGTETMHLDEKPSFSEKNQGLEVEGVERSNEDNDFRDSDPSVHVGSLSNGKHDTTLIADDSDVGHPEDGKQELVAQVAETLPDQVITEDIDEPKHSVSCCLPSAVVQVNYTQVTGSFGPLSDPSQDVDVKVAGVCCSNHVDQRIGSSPLVENEPLEIEVETVAGGGCHQLDESQFESQSHPTPMDSDEGSLVENFDNHPGTDVNIVEKVLNEDERTNVEESGAHATHIGTDVNKTTVEEVSNEDERIKAEESGAHDTHPGAGGKQKTFSEVFEEDGGTDVKEIGDKVTNPEKEGTQSTFDVIFKEGGSEVKEMLDGNKNIPDDVSKEGEGAGVKEMAGDVTHLGRDGNQKTANKVVVEDERTEIREVGDGNLKSVNEVFRNDDGMDLKDRNQMILNDPLKEDEGNETKEMGDDVIHLGSNGHQKNVEEVLKEDGADITEREDGVKSFTSDCLDENVTKNAGGVDSHVNQKIGTSEEVTTTLSSGTASVNDKQAFYGLETEKEGVFSVSDLVWGKVKSHPWWPGQIFDPSDASEQAMKYRKKDTFLVAYFGDRTFAWNEASLLKPFRTHFSQMEKQSNLESFRKAVNCALDEIARRVELGLACSCTSEEVFAKIGSRMIENTGIRKESSRREGTDKPLSLSSFKPEMLVEYIRALALFPYGGVDRLELVIAQAQLLALCRSRGYPCLPKFQLCGGLVENETNKSFLVEGKHSREKVDDTAAISQNEDQVLSGKGKLKSQDRSSRKRKHTSADGVHPRKKERSLSELMAMKKAFSSDDGNESVEQVASKPLSSSSGKKRKPGEFLPGDTVIQNKKSNISLSGAADADSAQPKRSFKVGESICRVASQLTGSPPILKCSSERPRKGAAKVDQSSERSNWVGGDVPSRTPEQRRKIVIPTDQSSTDEMLSQLCLAARDPMKGYSFLSTIISFFSEFRNSVCLDHTCSWRDKMSSEKVGGKKKRSTHPNTDSNESYIFEDMQDSYWTDRIVQIGTEEEPLDKGRKKRGRPRKKMFMLTNGADNSPLWSPILDIVQQNPDDNAEQLVEKPDEQPVEFPLGSVDANSKDYNSPAALILSFSESDADCVPSEKNLNRLFRHFGPLKESETEVLKRINCARVVFKRGTDAEVALSSAGKFSIFGPTHVSYSLIYLPSTPAEIPSLAALLGTEEVAPQGTEDMVPQQMEDMAPEGVEGITRHMEDVAPQGMEYMAPEGAEDMPQNREVVAPECTEDMAPEHRDDAAPLDTEDVARRGIEDMMPQHIEMAPEGMEVLTPQHTEDVAAEGMKDMTPQHTEDVAAEVMEDMAPEGTVDMPQHIEAVALQEIKDMAPQQIENMPPQGTVDMGSEGIEDMAPECMEEMAQKHTEDVAQEGTEDRALEGTKDMAPQYVEDMAPQYVEDMASQQVVDIAPRGIEDMASVGGSTS